MEEKELARQLRRIALHVEVVPADIIVRELRALADHLHPPIKGGKVVTSFGPSRVTRKSHARQSFRIHVEK